MRDQTLVLPEDGGDSFSCTAVTLMINDSGFRVHVCDVLQAGASSRPQFQPHRWLPTKVPAMSEFSFALVWQGLHDLQVRTLELYFPSTILFCIELPGVGYDNANRNLRLFGADGTGFYPIHVTKEFCLCVWLYKMDQSGVGNWRLVDTVCLHQVEHKLFYVHVSRRTVENVYELYMAAEQNAACCQSLDDALWPPTFPVMNNNAPNQNE
ncbi:uncharacterized protein C2845_PM11G16800 [Panicum miliaceum]|uniref:F-box protein AT5G49610-like beta-propeller domain-containing protein n=1 Tax=Panicum miliaceum TaxID=4540 RepID=A0A3L6RQK3_PANMI|nr:uncharacterized protein C2845_PM11G16800 [Panicum miliaceum]